MEVVARTRAKILLRLLLQFRPEWLLVLVVYYVLLGGALLVVCDGRLRADLVRPVVNAIAVPLVLLSGAWYVWHLVSGLSRCRLCLRGDKVIIRGLTSGGLAGRFVERQYHPDKLASVAIGEPLHRIEQLLERIDGPGVARFLRAGRMHVVDRTGGRVVFHLVHVAFDPGALLAFVCELNRRGVAAQIAV